MQRIALGPHFLNEGFDTMVDMLDRVPMKTVKLALMDVDWGNDPAKMAILKKAKEVGCIIVGRRAEKNPDIMADDIKEEAAKYYSGEGFGTYGPNVDSFDAMASRFPEVDIWEGPNEVDCKTLDEMGRYAAFLNEFARLLKTKTNKAAGLGSWSVGTPDLKLWSSYVPALEACKQYGAVLTRHGYGPLIGDEGTWFSLRHRLDETEFQKLGYVNTKVYITECGADKLGTFPGNFRQVWGYADEATSRYWGEYLKLLCEELDKDSDYVGGAHIFTCGNGGADVWNSFDIAHTNLADSIIANPPSSTPSSPVVEPKTVYSRPESNNWLVLFTGVNDVYHATAKHVTWGMDVSRTVIDAAGVAWYKVNDTPELWVLADQTSASVTPPILPITPVTPVNTQPITFSSHGIVGRDFSLEKTTVAVSEPAWFNFNVINTSADLVSYTILAARTEEGQCAQSRTNASLKPGESLVWRDHMQFHAPGTYHVYLGIGYDDKDKCINMQAPWDRLSASVLLTVQ